MMFTVSDGTAMLSWFLCQVQRASVALSRVSSPNPKLGSLQMLKTCQRAALGCITSNRRVNLALPSLHAWCRHENMPEQKSVPWSAPALSLGSSLLPERSKQCMLFVPDLQYDKQMQSCRAISRTSLVT